MTREPWHPMPGPNHHLSTSSRPDSHMSNGGIDWVASSRISAVSAVDVVALEGVDVAREELPLVGVHRRGGVGAVDVALLERGPRPLERAVDRGDARVEQLGDLAGLPAQHLAQDQHRPLAGRQVLERGHEGQADRVALHAPARPDRPRR